MKKKALLILFVFLNTILLNQTVIAGVTYLGVSESYDTTSDNAVPAGMHFNTDGTKVFVIGSNGTEDEVNEYSLTTAFDISTTQTITRRLGIGTNELGTPIQDLHPYGITFNGDGTKLYISGNGGNKIYELDLGSAFNISSATLNGELSTNIHANGDGTPCGITFNNDGTKLFLAGFANHRIVYWSLSTPYSVESAGTPSAFSVSTTAHKPRDVDFNSDGTKMYVVSGTNDHIAAFDLASAFDLSGTVTHRGDYSVNSQDNQPFTVEFSSNGLKMFMQGYNGDDIHEYSLTTAFEIINTVPTLSSSVPADNATSVAVDSTIVLNFSESVDAESGNITIKKTSGNSTVETIDVTGGQVTGSGTSQITVTPSSDFDASTEYYVLIDATAFDDSESGSYAGISSTTALSFTTANAVPTLSSSVPADNATSVAVDSTIVLNFSESVDAESGNITIKKTSGNSTVETIDVTGGQVTGSGTSQITVTPSSDFDNDTEYYVLIDATAFDDASANSYAGISSTTALSFTTALEDPTNDKDVIGLMEVQTEAPKKIISRATSPIYNRLNWIRAYNLDDKLLAQKINLKFNDPKLNKVSELISQSISNNKPEKKITDSWLFWSEGSVGTGTVKATSKSSKKKIDTNAVTLGMDKKINNQSVHGYAVTYIQEDAKVGDKGTSSEIDSYSISLYRAFSQGNNNYFEGILGLSELDITNIRRSGNNTLNGTRKGKQIFGSLQAINTFKNKQTEVSPNVRLDLGYTILDAYSEIGTNPLKYDEQTVETIGIYGGINLSNEITKEDYIFRPSVALELGYDLSPDSDVSLNYISDPNTKYTKSIDQEDDKSIKGKIGFDVVNDIGPSMMFFYERVETEDSHSDTLYLTVGYVTHRKDEIALGLVDQTASAIYKKNINGFDISLNSEYEISDKYPDYSTNFEVSSKF